MKWTIPHLIPRLNVRNCQNKPRQALVCTLPSATRPLNLSWHTSKSPPDHTWPTSSPISIPSRCILIPCWLVTLGRHICKIPSSSNCSPDKSLERSVDDANTQGNLSWLSYKRKRFNNKNRWNRTRYVLRLGENEPPNCRRNPAKHQCPFLLLWQYPEFSNFHSLGGDSQARSRVPMPTSAKPTIQFRSFALACLNTKTRCQKLPK